MSLPVVPDPFYWTESPAGPLLKCRPLEAVAPHFFTTRAAGLTSAADWRRVGDAAGAEHVATSNQVHGRAAVVIRRGSEVPSERRDADVLVSESAAVAVAVRAADCVPLLLADRRRGVVAAVHAGWRGTAAGAAPAAVDALRCEFGSTSDDLVAAVGPSIGPCCYEVGSDVVDAFAAAGHGRERIDRWFQAPPPARGRFEHDVINGRPALRLDLPGANRDQLVLAGVPESQIHLCGLCTAMNVDVLTSFRVERERAGRLAAVIRPRTPWPVCGQASGRR